MDIPRQMHEFFGAFPIESDKARVLLLDALSSSSDRSVSINTKNIIQTVLPEYTIKNHYANYLSMQLIERHRICLQVNT